MRNSNILNKWNNKNNNKQGNKNWIHNAETLLNGHVVYLVKFLGDIEVDQPKGIEVVKQGVQKLKFNHQLKKAESGSHNSKMPKAELTISVNGVTIQDPKSKMMMHQYPLHRISYCADDKAEKRFFSFIAKDADSNKHTCFVFLSDKLAEEITLTIGQAFELAYKKFLENSKDTNLVKKIEALEHENKELKKRLAEVAKINEVKTYMRDNNIADLCSVNPAEHSKPQLSVDNTTNDNIEAEEQNELICLDASTSSTKSLDFGGITLDKLELEGLHDDDFDPRASEKQPAAPALPPREFLNNNKAGDPFGMATFTSPTTATTMNQQKTFDALQDLDPFKNL